MQVFGPTDIIVILGQRGCGKTTTARRISAMYPKRVVIDRLRECNKNDFDFTTDSFDAFAAFMSTCIEHQKTHFKVCFQFDVEADKKEEIFSQVMRLCYKYGQITQENLCVHISEVHHFAAPTSIDKWLFESIMTGRHSNLAIIADSQRPASVSKALISQASHVFVGRLFEKRDVEYLLTFIGDDAYKAPNLAMPPKPSFLWYRPGQKLTIIHP